MKSLFELVNQKEIKFEKKYVNRRDYNLDELVKDINRLREGTTYKPTTKRTLAIMINKNPFLSKDNDALEYLMRECKEKGDYKKLYWVLRS